MVNHPYEVIINERCYAVVVEPVKDDEDDDSVLDSMFYRFFVFLNVTTHKPFFGVIFTYENLSDYRETNISKDHDSF